MHFSSKNIEADIIFHDEKMLEKWSLMRGLREKLMVKPKIAFSHTFRSTSFNFPKVGNKDKEGLFWKYEIEWLLLKMVTSLCFTVQPRSIPSRISARIMFHVFESTRYVCFSIKNQFPIRAEIV